MISARFWPSAALMRARCDFVEQHYQGALIDVGIGCGAFVELRLARGLPAFGYDVNPAGIRWLDERSLLVDPYLTAFDAMTLWDVLEHMPEFPSLIANARKWLFLSLPIFRDAEHVLGVGKRPVARIENREIPEALQPVQQAVCVPRQHRRQNDRVGEADCNRASGMKHQRIGCEECGGDERQECQHGDAAHGSGFLLLCPHHQFVNRPPAAAVPGLRDPQRARVVWRQIDGD